MNIDKDYLLSTVKMLDNSSISVDDLTTRLSNEYLGNINDNIKNELEVKIHDILTNYVNQENFDTEDVYKSLTNISVNDVDITPKSNPINYNRYINYDEEINNILNKDINEPTGKSVNLGPSIDYDVTNEDILEANANEPVIRLQPDEKGRYKYVDTSNNSGDIVAIDSDTSDELSNSSVKSLNALADATLKIPGPVAPYCAGMESTANDAINNIETRLNSLRTTLANVFNSVVDIDNLIAQIKSGTDISFNEIIEKYNKDQNSKVFEVDEEFFREHTDCKIIDTKETGPITMTYMEKIKKNGKDVYVEKTYTLNGKYAGLVVDGKTCFYDLNTHNFYVSGYSNHEGKEGTHPLNATIFLPTEATDYSKLNTYTYFVGDTPGYTEHIINGKNGKMNEDGNPDVGTETNSVLVQIKKNRGDSPATAWDKHDETAYMTKFANQIFDTDIEGGTCKNIIGGDSKYGANSLVVAARSNDLYQTVYCIDNAIIVKGENTEGKNSKTQITRDELLNLRGKDLYFIDVAEDGNLYHNYHNGNDYAECSPKDSYFISGLKLLHDVLTDEYTEGDNKTNIHIIYKAGEANWMQQAVDEMQALNDQYKDDSIASIDFTDARTDEMWTTFFSKDWETHTEGNYVTPEMANSAITNYNSNTAKNKNNEQPF